MTPTLADGTLFIPGMVLWRGSYPGAVKLHWGPYPRSHWVTQKIETTDESLWLDDTRWMIRWGFFDVPLESCHSSYRSLLNSWADGLEREAEELKKLAEELRA